MGKLKDLLIEQETLAQIIIEAIESGDYVVCERCGSVTAADQMFGPVCNDCAMDLVEDGLEREEDEMLLDEVEELLEDLIAEKVARDFCDMLVRDAAPAGMTFYHDSFF